MRRGIGHYSQLIIYNNMLNSYSGKTLVFSGNVTLQIIIAQWGGGGGGVAKYQITCFH